MLGLVFQSARDSAQGWTIRSLGYPLPRRDVLAISFGVVELHHPWQTERWPRKAFPTKRQGSEASEIPLAITQHASTSTPISSLDESATFLHCISHSRIN